MMCQGLALKILRLQICSTNEISNDPVTKMKALKILKVYNYLFISRKSQLTNQYCDFKELLQWFEENKFVNL